MDAKSSAAPPVDKKPAILSIRQEHLWRLLSRFGPALILLAVMLRGCGPWSLDRKLGWEV